MTNFLLAGGGTAGHINPMLSLADAIMAESDSTRLWTLGTKGGMEAKLVPERGYELLLIDRLPFPRRPNAYALGFPRQFLKAVRQVQNYLRLHKIDVVVGFGGFASAPAYLAAKREGVKVVVHEANALPGLANRYGARFAAAVGVAFRNTKLPNAQFVGMPLRREIRSLLVYSDRAAARKHFGLDENTTTLLVTGGSLGAKKINEGVIGARNLFSAAGIQVLHIVGDRSDLPPETTNDYVRIAYCDRMDLAIAAADFAISRAGASTVCEFAAIGLPAVFIPYPVGNGEQKFNVADLLAAGGCLTVADADFSSDYIASTIIPVVSDSRRLKKLSRAAKQIGVSDGDERLLKLINSVLSPK